MWYTINYILIGLNFIYMYTSQNFLLPTFHSTYNNYIYKDYNVKF